MRGYLIGVLLLSMMPLLKGSVIEVCGRCEVSTLQAAYDQASPYDTLLIKEGVYEAIGFEIRKPLTIIGEDDAVLDGKGQNYILKVLSDEVHVSNLRLINAGRSYTKDYAAIYISRSNHFSIVGNTIIDPFFGVLIEKSHYGLIAENKVESDRTREASAGNGVHAWHSSNLTIRGNELSGLRDGIYLEFVEESTISMNNSHNNLRYGLHFMFSNHDNYLDNTFRENGAGVAVMFSKFIQMKRNRFIQNWGTASYGLLLKEIYDAEVEDNIFEQNTIGIFIEGCTRVNYLSNDFERNGWAVKVSGGSYANIFSRNNFLSNSFDVSYNSKMNDNKFEGNYWSSYAGYDLNKDQVGDVPYRPVKLFSYVVNKTPETIILLRSLFVDIINFSERVSPVFTPDKLIDKAPAMKIFR